LLGSFFAGLGLVARLGAAAEMALEPAHDNSMYEEYPGNSNGAGYLFAGRAGGGGIRRALLRFDVARSIPAGARIDAVQLRLSVSRASNAAPEPAALHRMLAPWGEASSNAGERSGSGTAAQDGDATWS